MTTPSKRTIQLELAPRAVAWLLAVPAGLWLLDRLWIVVLLLVVALIFVGTINPFVESLEARGLTRGRALALLLLLMSLAAALLLFLTIPPLIEQVGAVLHDLPAQRDRLVAVLGEHDATRALGRALGDVGLQGALQQFGQRAFSYSADAAAVIGYGATTLVLSFYLLVDGKRTRGVLFAVVPRAFHMRTARIILNLGAIVGGYMRGQLITSVAFGGFTFVLLSACGVRNALALALLAAVADVLPFVGAAIAVVPAAFTALARGTTTAAIVLMSMAVYQEFENRILVPRIYGRALRLSPAAVVLALIAGGTLLGVLGALLALPIAAGLQMIVEELGVELPGDDSDDPSGRARDEKTEAAYKQMSAGTTAPEAGQIANELATDLRDADAWVAANEIKKKAP